MRCRSCRAGSQQTKTSSLVGASSWRSCGGGMLTPAVSLPWLQGDELEGGWIFAPEIAVGVWVAQCWVHMETFAYGTKAFVMVLWPDQSLWSLFCTARAEGTAQGAGSSTKPHRCLVAASSDRGTKGSHSELRQKGLLCQPSGGSVH